MRVLVTGAYGFIGSHIVTALVSAGHEVICAVRKGRIDRRFPQLSAVACDMARDVRVEAWLPRLVGIDAVVNCAGILREDRANRYENVHVQAPWALYRACVESGIKQVVQISALGFASDGAFIASKHRGDALLTAMPLSSTILRPSLVYSVRGSYGGTSLLRAMAALPWMIVIPRSAMQPCVQPIAAEDVGLAVAAALRHPRQASRTLELVGPCAMGLDDYLQQWRHWLDLPVARLRTLPNALVRVACWFGEKLGRGPLGETMLRMLEHRNLGSVDAVARMRSELDLAPRPLECALLEAPSQEQDRWHARLYFALPALRASMAALWLASGIVGWMLPSADVMTAETGTRFNPACVLTLTRASATLDLLLGALCLLRWKPRWVLGGMLAAACAYTLGIGLMWPTHWFDPFGGLLKNLPVIAALLVLLAVEPPR